MKRFLTILFVLVSYLGISQSPVQRSGPSNTIVDSRWMAALNMFVPVFPDTATAATQKGIDSVSLIYTRDVDNLWYRALQPHRHWQLFGTGSGLPSLPDGIYTGGDVAWSGNGLVFNVSPASYVLNGLARTYDGGTVTLDPADATFDRRDAIILDNTGANKKTGVPSATPQDPSVDPQTQLGRAYVTIPANSTTPSIQTNILFDLNLGQPSEWDATSNGTVVFGNTNFPYHLTIAFAASGFTNGNYILFHNDSAYNSSEQGSLVGFIRLGGALTLAQNININLIDASGNITGQTLNLTTYGINRNLLNSYQPFIIPMPDFGAANLKFKGVKLTASGTGTFPQFNGDYFQFQNGFNLLFSQQNAFTSVTDAVGGQLIATTPASVIPIIGSNAILATINGSNKVEVSGIELIRNDTYFGATQPSSAVNVDQYIKVLHSGSLSSLLTVQGTPSGLGSLATFQAVSTANCCAFGGYNYYNTQENIAPSASTNSLIGIRLGQRNNAFFESAFIEYAYDGNTAATSHVGIGFVDPIDAPMPFAFGADSTFKILRPMLGGDNSFKLDVGAKSRFKDALQSGYLTAGARITDSTLLWKKAIDSLINNAAGSNVNVGSGFRIVVASSKNVKTLFSDITGVWDSASNSNGLTYKVDTTVLATRAYANNVSGGGGFTGVTNVAGTGANGFLFSITNPSTTPNITLTTSITNGQIVFANSSAITGSVNLTWVTATNRLGVGATGASYLSLAPSTTSQSSINFGNGGTAPTAPNNADGWVSGNHFFVRLNGVSTQIDNQSGSGVLQAIGTANQVNVSGATGNVTFSLPQSIATASSPTFTSLTLGGTAATTPLTFVTNTDASATAGRWFFNTTRLGFSLATTILRVPLTTDAAPANGALIIGNGTGFQNGFLTAGDNGTLVTNSAGGITVKENSAFQTLSSGATITWDATSGYNANITLGNVGATLNITNPVDGRSYMLVITQDGTGSRTITTWPSGTLWPSGTAPTLSTAAGAINVVVLTRRGATYIGEYNPNRYQ